LGAVNGLVPHFTGGRLHGRVSVAGRDTARHQPRDLADVVGFVGQDPEAGFVAETVEAEIAFGMEQLAVPAATMRQRVEEVLDLLGLVDLRRRPPHTLSGGQQQRVAIAAVLALGPAVLVLDEPTSALDPGAAEEVLAAILRVVHDLGVTALVAEHRLERIVQLADAVVEVRRDGTVKCGAPAEVMAAAALAPPVVQLGRLAGWRPLPLSIRDARRAAVGLRQRLADHAPARATAAAGEPLLRASGLTVTSGEQVALRGVDVDLRRGEVVALMGRNGSGKSTLLWALQGSDPHRGTVRTAAGVDVATLPPAQARRHVTLVPQTPGDLLYLDSVAAECGRAEDDAGAPAGTCAALLAAGAGDVDPATHPRDLSEGQRLALALAVQLCAAPGVVLLDEPTRGLDYRAKEALAATLARLAADGRAVLVATHDVEFVAVACQRVVVLADGDVVADGPTGEVALASPTLAPQVARILHPGRWLTVAEVAAALATPAAVAP
ncbi:MAG: ABC transporter ATP-binding protein, partial [Actinobacteria bacterium]|nr:ABC transporter ATP-binding protein [Actinomycetota bacterium]